uniref:PRAME family member 12-like n=1 Tax=Urocitellus parryii TaxID=9999 RepID=A0A8D2HEP1_UROPR
MSIQSPPRLLELAGRRLLSNKSMAVLILEDLPIELFPPLFVEAFSRGHTEVLKKMVQAWPFTCLPLGALMKKPQLEMLRVALDGLDMLLAQQDRPRNLKTPLETLSITNCPLSDSDWNYLSRCPNTSQLRHLDLRYIKLTNFSPEPLKILLETVASTLNRLDLEACGIADSQLQAILPALSRCSKLRTFCFCRNRISMSVLRDLLCHTARLSQLSIELYPAPLESYDAQGAIHLERCSLLCAELIALLKDFRQPKVLIFDTVPCPQCGHMFIYNQGLIHCFCPTAA